jgi:hypothetical protein
MCRMTDMGVRYHSAIKKPGRYLVMDHPWEPGDERYVRADSRFMDDEYRWLGKPRYAIRVKPKDWGVRA